LLVFSVFFSFFGIELSVLAVTGVILVMIWRISCLQKIELKTELIS
jgi:small neutral amino acid transporter SnatA (MarC family)